MRHRWVYSVAVLLSLLALAASSGLAHAQSTSGSYSLSWWTVDGGGGASSATGYNLNGTAGQADAGFLSSPTYQLSGGFWFGPGAVQHLIHLPFIIR